MSLFGDDRNYRIHKCYQSLVAYEEGRILDLENYLEKLGLEKTCDDTNRRMGMLRVAIHEGKNIELYNEDIETKQLYLDIVERRQDKFLDYSQITYHDAILDGRMSIRPCQYPIDIIYDRNDEEYENDNSELGLKALVKVGNVYYRQTNSRFNQFRINANSYFREFEKLAVELELKSIILTYYCRMIDGASRGLSDAAWRSTCQHFGLNLDAYKHLKFFLYTYQKGCNDDINNDHLMPINKNSKLTELDIDPEEEYMLPDDDSKYLECEKLIETYELYRKHEKAGCFNGKTCKLHAQEDCNKARKAFIHDSYNDFGINEINSMVEEIKELFDEEREYEEFIDAN